MSVAYKGFLIKRGQKVKNWRRRWFVLFDHGALTYYKAKEEPSDADHLPTAAGTLDLSQPNTVVASGSNMPSIDWPASASAFNAFCIKTSSRTIFVYWEDSHLVSTWINALNKVIAATKSINSHMPDGILPTVSGSKLPPAAPAPYRPKIVELELEDSDDEKPTEAYSEVRFDPTGRKITVHIAPDGSVTIPTATQPASHSLSAHTDACPADVEGDVTITGLNSRYEELSLEIPRYENLAIGSEAPPLPP